MTKVEKIIQALTREGSLIFADNLSYATELEKMVPNLKTQAKDGCEVWFENDAPTVANTRVKIFPTRHIVFYNKEGRRFLCTDPEGTPLHEALWTQEDGKTQLALARMQLDCKQWVGIKPRAKTFSTQIDISTHDGWEKMELDDLREKPQRPGAYPSLK